MYRFLDLGIVTPAQIQFLTKNVVENTAADKLKSMGAIAYDPIKKDVYVSDANQKVGSIFRFKTTGDAAYTIIEPIVASKYLYRGLWPSQSPKCLLSPNNVLMV